MPSPRRLASLVALLAGLTVAPVSLAASAVAAPTGSTATDDVVLYERCQRHPISYRLALDPGTTLWHLDLTVADPTGKTSEIRTVSSPEGDATSGTVFHTFCGSEPAGTYTVRAYGFTQGLPGVRSGFTLPDTRFEVRPMATRTALSAHRLASGGYRLTSTVRQEGPRRYVRADGIRVRLERLAAGEWRRLSGTTLTTVRGTAIARVAGRPGQRVRAVVLAAGNHGASTSRALRLPR